MTEVSQEPSEAFVKLCMTVGSFTTACVNKMQGEGNDTANVLLHALALFIATSGIADARDTAIKFSEALPTLAEKYALAMHGDRDAE